MTHRDRAARAEAAILAQIVDTVEAARAARGLRVADVTQRSGVSLRTLTMTRTLQSVPSLRTLLAILDGLGLELCIRVRTKRTTL